MLTRRHLSLTVLITLLLTAPAHAGRQISVIVNASCPLTAMAPDIVRSHFLRQHKEWTDGAKVRPIQQEGAVQQGFLAKVLKMPPVDYERYWLERKYAAAESPPKSAEDDDGVIKFVGAMKGAIGAIDSSSLTDASKTKVHVVLTVTY